MSGPAQVRSSDAIEAFRGALAKFQHRVQSALDALDGELQRADAWIEHDRPRHWRLQLKEAEDNLHEAKIALERCLLTKVVAGERPACREEKKALEQAKARVEYCRAKAETVKHWQRNFRHESMEYQGRTGQLRRAMEQDVPNARAALAKILRRVEDYQLERPPEATDVLPSHAVPQPTAAIDGSSASPPPFRPPSSDNPAVG